LKTFDFTQLNTGSAVPSLNRNHVHELSISLPSLSEQKRIASILSSLDDKIDLLHRENKTLEAMAETLFRQWFIEEAKEDWKEVSLTRVANFLNGLACQKFPPKNEIEKLPILKIRELSNGIGDDSDYATTDVEKEYIVHAGDVIFAWSASLMVKIWDGRDCILNQHLFKVTSDIYPKWFYYFWCKHHLDEFIAIAQSHATTMGHIKRKDLENAIVLVPTSSELKTMTDQIEYLLQKIENNNKQIQTLIQQRDGLLPKLMSGEVKI
jgi:type I restriction enzyme S subunit